MAVLPLFFSMGCQVRDTEISAEPQIESEQLKGLRKLRTGMTLVEVTQLLDLPGEHQFTAHFEKDAHEWTLMIFLITPCPNSDFQREFHLTFMNNRLAFVMDGDKKHEHWPDPSDTDQKESPEEKLLNSRWENASIEIDRLHGGKVEEVMADIADNLLADKMLYDEAVREGETNVIPLTLLTNHSNAQEMPGLNSNGDVQVDPLKIHLDDPRDQVLLLFNGSLLSRDLRDGYHVDIIGPAKIPIDEREGARFPVAILYLQNKVVKVLSHSYFDEDLISFLTHSR